MNFYKIGPVVIESLRLPASYRIFETKKENISEHEMKNRIVVWRSNKQISIENETLASEHTHMKIWKGSGYWLAEDKNHFGIAKSSLDYRYVTYWIENEETYEEVFPPLLQLIIECRMIFTGIGILHAACVEKDGKAFAFTGPSGAGKSTKASKWVEELQAAWLSGDRPAINAKEKLVYGVPWDGKEQIFVNREYPLQCILEVRKATRTRLRKLSQKQVYELMVHQLMIPLWDTILTKKSFEIIKQIA